MKTKTVNIASQIYIPIFTAILTAIVTAVVTLNVAGKSEQREEFRDALRVLENKEKHKDIEKWAQTIVNVRVTESLGKLSEDEKLKVAAYYDFVPDELLTPPSNWKGINEGATWRDLAVNYLENKYIFETNTETLRALQSLILEFRKIESANIRKELAPNKSLNSTPKSGAN